jgi:cytochrome c
MKLGTKPGILRRGLLFAAVAGIVSMAAVAQANQHGRVDKAVPSAGMGQQAESIGPMMSMRGMRMPSMDPARGRELFVGKGCVACHSVNGVGGHDATALDAHTMRPMMNPFEFAAKMWRMAPAMIYAQEEALGDQIQFTGDELADLIAFVHSDSAQHNFAEADITPEARRMMDHSHGEPEGGVEAHAEEIGHTHGQTGGHGAGGTHGEDHGG